MEVNMEVDRRIDPELSDYEKGRSEAKYDAENALDELVSLLNFPHLEKVLGAEFARGYREYGNAWLVINRA